VIKLVWLKGLRPAFLTGWILGVLVLAPLTAGAGGLRYFKGGYDALQKKACTLQAQGSMAIPNSNEASLKAMADGKTMMLDSFYGMASTYGKDDVPGATTVLKNEARLNWDIKKFTRKLAEEALWTSEATLRFFLDKDKARPAGQAPQLAPGYEASVLRLVGQAEGAFAAGKYARMRILFYQALWTAYPVTSKAPFTEPKD
jgi:hypothetical protein